MNKKPLLLSLAISILLFTGCIDNTTQTPDSKQEITNPQIPIAKAKMDRAIIQEGEVVEFTLVEHDDITSLEWRDINGKLLSTDKKFNRLFKDEGNYKIVLTITDKNKNVTTDTIIVKVNKTIEDIVQLPNLAPIVKATATTLDIMDEEFIHLSDDGSYDPDGTITSYEWRDMDGILLSTTKTLDRKLYYYPQYDFNNNGTTRFVKTLYVTDNQGKVSSKSFEIIVNKKPSANQSPTIDVGLKTITIAAGSSVKLNVTASDPDGDPITYEWKEGAVAFSLNASFTANDLAVGTHIFTVTVKDDKGAKAIDTVTVIVKPPVNNAPVADAGSDQNIVLGENVIFNALNSSDVDGDSITYEWKEDGVVFSTDATFTKNDFTLGEHNITLTVTDDKGLSNSDIIIVNISKPTHEGSEFYFNFNENHNSEAKLKLFISSKDDATGVVKIEQLGFKKDFNVTAGVITEIQIPTEAQKSNLKPEKLAVYVKSKRDITVYGLNQRKYTTDAFLALPVKVLGLEYITINYTPLGDAYPSQVSITATKDNTNIIFTPIVNANGVDGEIAAGQEFSKLLQKGEVLMFTSSKDLTASKVEANRPIAVTSGNKCANIPNNIRACDHLVEMLPPLSSLGKEFYVHPLNGRKADLIRVVASENNTTIKLDGVIVATINQGEYFDKIHSNAAQIITSKPSMVAQYSLGQEYDRVKSDPFMMLITPITQYLDSYTFATLGGSQNFNKNFVNVVISTEEVDKLQLDGKEVNSTLFSTIGSSGYSSGSILLNSAGTHNLTANRPFATFIYGFGESDSYGYPGGMFIDTIKDKPATNTKPIIITQIIAVTESKQTSFILRASDAENDPLTFQITTQPKNGTLTGDGPYFTYKPNDGFIGKDSFMIKANDGQIDSEIVNIEIEVKKEEEVINGYVLPPEPDENVNNSTLLGVDVNSNGVRDDVERYIVKKYKDHHKIVTEIGFQQARAFQQILDNPLNKELHKELQNAQECNSYFEEGSVASNDPILIDHLINLANMQINTKSRMRAYLEHNRQLSGGVYRLTPLSESRGKCAFDVDTLLGVK